MKMLPNLQQKRKEKGFTTKYMAKVLGISIRTYRAYEQGRRNPGLEATIKILEILECTLDQLTKVD